MKKKDNYLVQRINKKSNNTDKEIKHLQQMICKNNVKMRSIIDASSQIKPQNPKYLNPETLKPKTQNIEPDFETPKHIKILKKNEVTEPQTNLIIT